MNDDITKWINREKRREGRKGRRAIRHFDTPIDLSAALKFISPPLVAAHQFFPFIYFPKKVRRYQRKPDGTKSIKTKIRPIMYASNRDAYIYSFYGEILNSLYEGMIRDKPVHDSVIAYRTTLHKSNVQFAKEVFDYISQKGECTVLTFDVASFFDHISHSRLKQAWCSLLNTKKLPDDHYKVFRSITHYSFVERSKLETLFAQKGVLPSPICDIKSFRIKVRPIVKENRHSEGIPQGSPLSGLLANIYMLDFDQAMTSATAEVGGLYRRYSDDIAIVCPQEKSTELKSLIAENLSFLGLSVQPNKTTTTLFFKKGEDLYLDGVVKLQYLGFEFDGKGIYIRSSTVARKLRKAIRYTKRGTPSNNTRQQRKRFKHPQKYGRNYYFLRSMTLMKSSQLASQISRVNRTMGRLIRA